IPVYPASSQLPSDTLARVIDDNLDPALAVIEEWFEPELLKKNQLLPRREAYEKIHRPAHLREAMQARRRLIYDELMLMQVGLGISRKIRGNCLSAPVLRADKLLDERIRARFKFQLTTAQQ